MTCGHSNIVKCTKLSQHTTRSAVVTERLRDAPYYLKIISVNSNL